MAIDALKCKECSSRVPARRPLRLRAVLRPARGRLHAASRASTSPRCAAASRAGPQHDLALRRLPAPRGSPLARGGALPTGCTPLVRADRLAERLGLGEVWVKNDAANPTHSFKDRVVVGRAGARAASWASRRSPAPRPATWRTRSPPTPRRPGWSPTSSSPPTSRSRRSSPPASTARTWSPSAATTTTSTGCAPSCRASTRLGLRQRQPAPVLRRGLQDARLRDRRAARLGAARPRRRPDRLRARCSPRSPAASRSGSSSGLLDGRRADVQRRAGRRLLAGGRGLRRRPRRLPPGQARTRSPSRWPSATRPTGPTRSTSPAARAAASTP